MMKCPYNELPISQQHESQLTKWLVDVLFLRLQTSQAPDNLGFFNAGWAEGPGDPSFELGGVDIFEFFFQNRSSRANII